MVFTVTEKERTCFGDKAMVMGVYTNDTGSIGGDIKTGLKTTFACILTPQGAAVGENAPVVNETFPLAGGDITIVTDADAIGTFVAIGTTF